MSAEMPSAMELKDRRNERVGKSVRGQITACVVASPESLLFEVTDDGKGLDFQSIQSKAIQLGLIQKNQRLSREDLAQFILRPGFTTRDSINTIVGEASDSTSLHQTWKRCVAG